MLLAATCVGPAFFVSQPAATATAGKAAGYHHHQAPVDPGWLHRLRREMSKFKDPRVAERYGYRRTNNCSQFPYNGVDGKPLGGMGYHYFNARLVADPAIDLFRPEVMVYVPDGRGGRTLGAVEYFRPDRDQRMATPDDRPTLLGRQFQGPMEPHEEGMAIHYDMHIWLFKHNPKGLFEPWNPRVTCPTAHRSGGHGH
jgi:hypothetical protein